MCKILNIVRYQRQVVNQGGAGDEQIDFRRGPALIEQFSSKLPKPLGDCVIDRNKVEFRKQQCKTFHVLRLGPGAINPGI